MFDLQTTGSISKPDAAATSARDGGSLTPHPPAAHHAAGASAVRLELGADQRLWLRRGSDVVSVRPVRCFPWSSPDELISLRDADENEQLLVVRAADLDPASAEALARAMLASGFVLRVEAVLSIEVDYEVRSWRIRTSHGSRTFQTRLDEWPWPAPGGGHLLRDLAGDVYYLPALDTLDAATRRLLWAYVG